MIPPVFFIAGIKAGKYLMDKLGSCSSSSGHNDFSYKTYAVLPRHVRAFLADHPDAMPAEDFYNRLLSLGHRQAAKGVLANCSEHERERPGHVIFIGEVRDLSR